MSTQLTVEKRKALEVYNSSDASGKSALQNLLGKDIFQYSYKDIKTFEDALQALGITDWDLKPGRYPSAIDGDIKSIIAYTKLIIIARALNGDWKPDWSNSSQYKYVPWFYHNPASGFGLSYLYCVLWLTFTSVGSRLCYKSREIAEYAAKQFASEYNDFLTIQ